MILSNKKALPIWKGLFVEIREYEVVLEG